MNANVITKKLRVNMLDLIKFKIITELVFIRKEQIINSDMEFLTLLSFWGPMDLKSFCSLAAKHTYRDCTPEEFPIREQNVRNRVVKLEKRGFIEKSTTGKRHIKVSDSLSIPKPGNVLINYNLLAIAS